MAICMSFKLSYGITRDSGEESISDNIILLEKISAIIINSQTAVSCKVLTSTYDSICIKTIINFTSYFIT
jgi:hypothetical protein